MSLRILMALALGLAAGAVLPPSTLAQTLTPVVIEQHGSKLNMTEVDTASSSYIIVDQQSSKNGLNSIDATQTGETNTFVANQIGGGNYLDVSAKGDTTIMVRQEAGVSGNTSDEDGIQRGFVDGNYITVYNNGDISIAEVSNEISPVGHLGRF